jgi:hypothetical protein
MCLSRTLLLLRDNYLSPCFFRLAFCHALPIDLETAGNLESFSCFADINMSAPTTTPQVVLSFKDSPLSTTGNVLGILTFAAAIYVSVLVYVNSMRSASKRLRDMVEGLELLYREAEHLPTNSWLLQPR